MSGQRVRVLVVEDSLTVRKRIVEALARDPALEVVGEADDGRTAVEMCRDLRPSVVTLDMVLPVMSGLAATEVIMAYCPTPILVVSGSFNRRDLFRTYDALQAGAVDVLEKPCGDDESDATWDERLVQAVKVVSRIKVITHPRARLGGLGRPGPHTASLVTGERARRAPLAPGRQPAVVAIGASTGGPAAVVEILRALPPRFRIPVLLCLHIGEQFAEAFASWLDGVVPRPAAYVRHGETLASMAGRVVIAPPGAHLRLRSGRAQLDQGPARHSCRPSIDVLFESVAEELGDAAVGCLLTGMGRDGAAGLLSIRQTGGLTFAQDESTSVVYGMPREAARLGAAAHVLPLSELGPALAQLDPGKIDA